MHTWHMRKKRERAREGREERERKEGRVYEKGDESEGEGVR